jgi:hypothetical protein
VPRSVQHCEHRGWRDADARDAGCGGGADHREVAAGEQAAVGQGEEGVDIVVGRGDEGGVERASAGEAGEALGREFVAEAGEGATDEDAGIRGFLESLLQ